MAASKHDTSTRRAGAATRACHIAIAGLAAASIMHTATLEQIRAASDRLRVLAQAPTAGIVRTAPEHAELRRLLVEWAEPEFLNNPSVGSSTLDARLSAALSVAGLMQPNKIKDSPEFGEFGTVRPLKLFHPQGDRDYLVLQTGLGIVCGTSYAHYLYRWQGRRWVRVLALEPVESDGFYLPDVVMLERRNGAGDALFLVGGASQWCSSRFGRVGAKLFEIRGTEAKLVLQIRRMADRTADPPLAASLLFDDVTLRYQAIGRLAMNYVVIERYRWRNRTWQRSAPLAPSPEQFVMQWEVMSWEEAARWARGDLSAGHQQLKATTFEELYNRGKCGGSWVISGRTFGDNQDKEIYVLVEEAQPLDFRVLSVSDKPPDGCRLP